MLIKTTFLSVLSLLPAVQSQVPSAKEQSTSFNSSFTLSKEQIEAAQLSDSLAENIQNIVNFDRSQLAYGGPWDDDFYTLPPSSKNKTGKLEPGVVLKTQVLTDPTSYAIPPNTGLSRILYTTKNLNGTVVPASAFILWPFTLRQSADDEASSQSKAKAVLWCHGTSGFFQSQAPSAHRSLWYANTVPFTIAQAGYAVIASDYAGLGVSKSWDGSEIPHQYLASPAGAQDSLYAMRAAMSAFPQSFSGDFVTMGHSQGGGVAWAVAEALHEKKSEFADLVDGYKGTIAGSPTTDVVASIPSFVLPWVGLSLDKLFTDFRLDYWLAPLGVARAKLLREIEAGISVSQQLLLTDGIVKEGWEDTWFMDAYAKLANAGRKEFAGPLLVIQGTDDVYVPYNLTRDAVSATWDMLPKSDLEFLVIPGVGHVPALDATRSVWLKWIDERFDGKPLKKSGNVRTELNSFLPLEQYLKVGNSFLQWAGAPEYSYQVPLGY